jgi:membrane associated rhomboid family serine protease
MTNMKQNGVSHLQFLQLYVAGSLIGGLAQTTYDRRSSVIGASAAVNAMVIFSVCLNPFSTYLVMGIVPAPAWLVGGGFLLYDVFGASRVRLLTYNSLQNQNAKHLKLRMV